MLENLDLSKKFDKSEYKKALDGLEIQAIQLKPQQNWRNCYRKLLLWSLRIIQIFKTGLS